jgi:hypothetical protein
MKWRKWNNIIHRDLGYLCAGLTIVYVVSGIAVNHVRDWNPNFKIESASARIEPVPAGDPRSPAVIREILSILGASSEYRDSFRPDSNTLEIFTADTFVSVDLVTGDVLLERVKSRTLLREANFLHLNHAKKLWTYMADLYAIGLGLLAITGLFVLKGRKGITGRGAWLTGMGVLIPVVFLWLYL